MPKPSYLLDTGPLSVLCGFPLYGTSYIHTILSYADLVLTDYVVIDVQAGKTGKIARTISPLLKDNRISVAATPVSIHLSGSYVGYVEVRDKYHAG